MFDDDFGVSNLVARAVVDVKVQLSDPSVPHGPAIGLSGSRCHQMKIPVTDGAVGCG